jgi:hypothetical protein
VWEGVYELNSFNPMSTYSEILKISYLRRVVPRLEILLLPGKFLSMIQVYLRDMFNKASKSGCTTSSVVSPGPVSYFSFFSYEDSRKHRR